MIEITKQTATKLVAEALPCIDSRCARLSLEYQRAGIFHVSLCPASRRPAVESLVTRLLADRERIELEARIAECDHWMPSGAYNSRKEMLQSKLAALAEPSTGKPTP